MKEKRYDSMVHLRDSLNQLFEQCGMKFPKVEIEMSPIIIKMVNCIIRDKAICDFLDSLADQSIQAEKRLADMKSKLQNYERNEETRRKKAAEYEEDEKKRQKKENNKKKELENCLASEKERSLELEAEIGRQKDQLAVINHKFDKLQNEKLDMIKQVIGLRDNLVIKLDIAREMEEKNVIKVIEGELSHTKKVLEDAGVEVTDQVDEFDSSKHMIVGVRPAEDPNMADKVAEILRPGYVYGEEVIRPAELILYTEERNESEEVNNVS